MTLVLRAVEEFPVAEWRNETTITHITQRATSYFQYPGKLTKIESEKRSGINAHSGNRWYRWVNVKIDSVRLNSAGKYLTASKNDKVWLANLDYWLLSRDDNWKRLFKETFGVDFSYATIHPLAPHYDLSNPPVATGFGGSLKQANLREQVAYLFGKTRTRRDLMRAVGGSHPNAIMLARDFRGLVPVDWLADFLTRNQRLQGNGPIYQYSIRPILYRIDLKSYKSLLQGDPLDREIWYSLNDLGTTCRPNRGPYERGIPADFGGRFTTFEEIHNRFFDYARRQDRAPIDPQPVPATPLSESLSKIPGIVIPQTTEDLHTWGSQMSNCIGSYAHSVTSPKRSRELGGIYDGDTLIANFEISNGSLQQLLGKYNKPLPVGVRDRFESEFAKAGVKIPSEYWGSRGDV